jgi:hypothetical protein
MWHEPQLPVATVCVRTASTFALAWFAKVPSGGAPSPESVTPIVPPNAVAAGKSSGWPALTFTRCVRTGSWKSILPRYRFASVVSKRPA